MMLNAKRKETSVQAIYEPRDMYARALLAKENIMRRNSTPKELLQRE
jgi:hypothetical protein